ncbi:hypothetical protein OGATHE_002445 [Ogataea polymorpha]|uniref:Uncharacterized protein n=1 Tax=Ogataea polymorpha TaxID=460523 RepID=A0A9P8T7W7_9ASCO|nr:hypothetical protein OGATHE_002445 [Ogataea polymorpha]
MNPNPSSELGIDNSNQVQPILKARLVGEKSNPRDKGTDSSGPADSDVVYLDQTGSRSYTSSHNVSRKVVRRDGVTFQRGKTVHTIRVNGWESNCLSNRVKKHGDNRQSHASYLFLQRPAVYDHKDRHDKSKRVRGTSETVFRNSFATFLHPTLDCEICKSAPDWSSEKKSASRGQVKQRSKHRAVEIESWVDHVPDRGQKAKHVVHDRGADHPRDDQVDILESQKNSKWVVLDENKPFPCSLGYFLGDHHSTSLLEEEDNHEKIDHS